MPLIITHGWPGSVVEFHKVNEPLVDPPAHGGKAADAYKVYFAKVDLNRDGGYTIDHTSFIYLMDREGNYLGFFPPGTSAERMVEIIRPHLDKAER